MVRGPFGIGLAALIGAVLASGAAHAYSGGLPGGGCIGCHGVGDHTVSTSSNPVVLSPGVTATITVTVDADSGASVGTFVDANAGMLNAIGGQGLAEVNGGLTHTSPLPLSGGMRSFSFSFEVPAQSGAVRLEVWTLVANGNGSSSGDGASQDVFDFVYGCNAQTYWRDGDGDGYGRTEAPLIHCAGTEPAGYASEPDDCDDNRDTVHPNAPEYCNQRDDDCDGEVDEDPLLLDLYPDADGDGFYSLAEFVPEDRIEGCVPTEGYAGEAGDCAPTDPLINPGAEEVCNGFDDNCDFNVDEYVRPRCGEGWCQREAPTCDAETCVPGEPSEETCNLLDDDCDALLDENACEEGLLCVVGECVPNEPPMTGGATDVTGSGSEDDGATMTSGSGGATGADGGANSGGGCGCRGGPTSDVVWLLALFALALRRRAGLPCAP